ncbi:MAG: glycosyltransferase [Pseudomonadota bacterium]
MFDEKNRRRKGARYRLKAVRFKMNLVNSVICVILHYGDERFTWECVGSLKDDRRLDIVVVDNDPNQSLAVPRYYSDLVNVYRTGGSMGFAEANNFGFDSHRKKSHQFVLVLNNDTVMQAGSVTLMLDALQSLEVGAVGPCMPYAGEPDKIWACGGYVNKIRIKVGGLDSKDRTQPYVVDYLPGAVILCKREVWDKAGGLPEKYFLAYEEVEFALRIKRLGYNSVVEPRAKVFHHVGMSSDKKPMYLYNSIRNRIRFSKFLHGSLFGGVWGYLASTDVIASRRFLLGRNPKTVFRVWWMAVLDEIAGRPLDRKCLLSIKRKFDDV